MVRRLAPILLFAAALVLVCDAAVVVVHYLNENTTLIAGKPRAVKETTEVQVVPAAGQAFVTGTLDRLVADNAQIQPLPSPLTITGERGVSRVTIEKALMGGRRVTINWDGGTPMPLSGDGGLDLGTTHVEASGDSLVYSLDGAPRAFLAGTYSIGTSVAVGTSGVATPRDGVQFTADSQTVLTSKGNPVVRVGLRRVDLLGPGKLQVSGTLKVQFPDQAVSASSVTFAEGPYRVTIDPTGGAPKIDAILQGQVDAS